MLQNCYSNYEMVFTLDLAHLKFALILPFFVCIRAMINWHIEKKLFLNSKWNRKFMALTYNCCINFIKLIFFRCNLHLNYLLYLILLFLNGKTFLKVVFNIKILHSISKGKIFIMEKRAIKTTILQENKNNTARYSNKFEWS